MRDRTYIRTMLDTFFDNALAHAANGLVNFCNENSHLDKKELKFIGKMPLNNTETEQYDKRFVFNTGK